MVGVTRVKLRVVVFTGPTIGWTCSRPEMSEEAESEMASGSRYLPTRMRE